MMKKTNFDVTIVLSGEAGQGIQTLERLAMSILKSSGVYVFSYSEFMSRIRGGNNSTSIRISSRPVYSFVKKIDIFIPFNRDSMHRHYDRISSNTTIIGDLEFIDEGFKNGAYPVYEAPLVQYAKEAGGSRYLNIAVLGLLTKLFDIEEDLVKDTITSFFNKLNDNEKENNLNALLKGMQSAKNIIENTDIQIPEIQFKNLDSGIMVDGSEAIALGGIAGGCNFISSYPMSPGTGVLVNMAKYSKEFDIIVEQAEDEICAINMAIASWYTGGRAMVTTSGGGFALMAEGMSLAGATESPVVVHVGQRPGPATGLPTRTEQGDLLFSLFSGHGEFPRVIFAPGDISQGFDLAQRSFYIADKYQVPVIILTDQFFLDSIQTVSEFEIDERMHKNMIIETDADYKRYKNNTNGVSSRGVPGFGKGIVCLDSDEHDEAGYITEDFSIRETQTNKRMHKAEPMMSDILAPDLYGPEDYRHLIVSWGSNLHCIKEALDLSKRDDVAFLHFSQVYPLHKDTEKYLQKAENLIIIENNYTSQFGKLIRMLTGFEFNEKILKYNGMPFSTEEITEKILGLNRKKK